MKHGLLLIILLAGSLVAHARERQEELRLRFLIFVIHGGMTSQIHEEDDIWAGDDRQWDQLKNRITLLEGGRFQIGPDQLKLNRDGCFWNDTTLFFGDAPTTDLPSPQVRMITAPDIYLGREDTSTVRIRSTRAVDYLVARSDGLYERANEEIPTGLIIKARPSLQDDRAELDKMMVRVTAVARRQSVPGLEHLPVGRPIVQSWEYELDLEFDLRRPYGLLVHPADGLGHILIAMDVTDVPPAVWETVSREAPRGEVDEVDWDDDESCYRIEVDLPEGTEIDLKIGPDGKLIQKRHELRMEDLPEAVATTVHQLHPEAKLDDLERIVENGTKLYRVKARYPGPDNDVRLTLDPDGHVQVSPDH